MDLLTEGLFRTIEFTQSGWWWYYSHGDFSGTKEDIYLKNNHTWGCPVYILDAIFQGNLAGISKWEPRSHAGIYLVHSTFHSGSVALFLNPENGHVSPQFHVVFGDEFSTVPFMMEGGKTPNWTDLVQHISQRVAPDNIDPKDTWFNSYIEEYPRKKSHDPIVSPDNNNNTLTSPQFILHV